MQLVAYGAQDIYLTGNPQITFFKVVYRRHTNFSMECIRQTFNGQVGANSSVTATISRNGDLVYKLYVTSSPNSAGITDGSAIVTDAELEIGGQRIDRHYQEWNEIWNELTTTESKAIGLKSMVGCVGTNGLGGTGVGKIQVPLHFWFCRNPGLALPLIALQYHEVKVKIQLGAAATGAASAELWADYIYLDTDERRRFAQVSHEYLIEQVQRQNLAAEATNRLNFNHPVKELIWTSTADYGSAHIKLNGHDRFALQEEEYFQLRQPFDYHTAVPRQNLPVPSQVSLLNRSAALDSIHAAGATSALITLGGGGAGNVYTSSAAGGTAGNFNITSNVLTLGINTTYDPATASIGTTAVGTGIPVGTQLAIVCSSSDASSGAAAAPATQGTVGTVYFATVLTAGEGGTQANAVTIGITTPTSSDATLTLVDTGLNADATFNVFAVTDGNSAQARTSQMTNAINVYSFALKPEEHQPSGTCNFSRIDNAQLVCSGTTTGLQMMYAVNYNVLRIMSGMGGLAYSN